METRPEHAALALAAPAATSLDLDDGYDDDVFDDEEEDDEEIEDELAIEREDTDDDEPRTFARSRDDQDDAEDGDSARKGRRRRRRGRRGGRRMRDDSRPTDVYAWTRPWVPYGEDPFVWYDPAEDFKTAEAAPAPARESAAPVSDAPAARPAPSMIESGDEIWVELPTAEEKPKRTRSRRGRGRGGDAPDAQVDAVSDSVLDAPIDEPAPAFEPEPIVAEVIEAAAPAPKTRKPRARKTSVAAAEAAPVAEVVAEPAPEPAPARVPVMAEAAPEPVPAAPRERDPNEISAPPTAPRKGWWRR